MGTLYNMVGFQTKLKHGEQAGVFRMIPGLERAQFARLGGLHRNTFVNSPRLLDRTRAAEGGAAHPPRRAGHRLRGLRRERRRRAGRPVRGGRGAGQAPVPPPPETAHGALLAHITGGADAAAFQPMNVNFGLFPPLPERSPKGERKPAIARRALAAWPEWQAA